MILIDRKTCFLLCSSGRGDEARADGWGRRGLYRWNSDGVKERRRKKDRLRRRGCEIGACGVFSSYVTSRQWLLLPSWSQLLYL
jgi:hypothetical protein